MQYKYKVEFTFQSHSSLEDPKYLSLATVVT